MVHARRRFLFFAAVVLVIVLLGAGGSFHGRLIPQHARAATGEATFDPVSALGPKAVNPPRLYAGDRSHTGPARSSFDDLSGFNGYCVSVITSLTPKNNGFDGFSIAAKTETSLQQGQTRNEGAILSVASSASAPPTTQNGDKLCAVVSAPVGYTLMQLTWSYTGGTCPGECSVTLSGPDAPDGIRVVTVILTATPTFTTAEICTVGWDSTFLVGANDINNWTIPSTVPPAAPLSKNRVSLEPTGEWCLQISIPAGSPVTVDVQLDFTASYNAPTRVVPHHALLSDTQPPGVVIPGTIGVVHIGANGEVLAQQLSHPLVIGTTEVVCILGSTTTDHLSPSDVTLSDISGPPDVAASSGVTVFHAGPGSPATFTGVAPAVPDGTLCFFFTSGSPGEQSINVFFPGVSNGLTVQWNRIDATRLTTGSLDSPEVTFGVVHVSVKLNLADSTLIVGDVKVAEFVLGSHRANGQVVSGPVDGAVMQASLTGGCGYFVVPDNSQPTTISGTSVGGRFELTGHGDIDGNPDDLTINLLHDIHCSSGQTVRISIDVFYPGSATPAKPTEYVDIVFDTIVPPAKTPRIAWVGDIVSITYAFSSDSSCAGTTVHFVRPKNQRGTFLAGPGITLVGNSGATSDFGSGCSASVNFVSVDPGEVDIEAFTDRSVTKEAFPIFYLALEDITLAATDTSVVSTVGEVDTVVRGWFVGTNPSGHPAKKLPDGRVLPADRWTLPDDWETLSGSATGVRNNWGSATMPPVVVTFLMQNDSVVNNFATGVKSGGLGWFLPFSNDRATPEVGRVPDVGGVVPKPRRFVDLSDINGVTHVLTFGDQNLSYEGCAKSAINGNPLCKPTDVVGHTVYYAVADYLHEVGKYPPIISNTGTTEWTWAGYKTVTIVPGETPQYKYVVAHLRDRDGFCDAAAFNNTLGTRVRFEIDAGGGVIIDAQGAPSTISNNRRFATATTFDTQDDLGNAINQSITKPVADPDNPDECQAWIKVSDSLLEPANVLVTFFAPPDAVPGDIRITGLSCNVFNETVTVTNKGLNTVSLDGFALRSLPSDPVAQEEHLGLTGLLAPGQSATFPGGPGAAFFGWLRAPSPDVFQLANDYVRLVWSGFEIDREYCDGTFSTPPLANPLPPDGEGEIILDAIIPFGQEKEVPLLAGWNVLPGASADTDLAEALAGHEQDVAAVYGWDATNETWLTYIPGAGSVANTLDKLHAGEAYWILVNHPFTLIMMR
jgi:hypothetical protein